MSKLRENIRQGESNVGGNVYSESKPGLRRMNSHLSHQSSALFDTLESYPITSHSRNGPWIMKPIYLKRLGLGRPFSCMWRRTRKPHMALCIPLSMSTKCITKSDANGCTGVCCGLECFCFFMICIIIALTYNTRDKHFQWLTDELPGVFGTGGVMLKKIKNLRRP